MKRSQIAFLLPFAALLALLVAAAPARADQVVYFVNGKAMTVKSVERGDRVTILEIEGGGRIGVPSVQIDRVEELQLSAPATAVVPPPAPAPAPVQPATSLQANAGATGNAAAPAMDAVVPGAVAPPSGLAVDPKTAPPAHAAGRPGGPLTAEQLEGGPPPQALPPAYNPGAARGGQFGMQGGAIGIGSRLNNNFNGAIGRPDGPGRRLNTRLGPFGRVRPPVSAPPAPPGQSQQPSGQGAAPPASAPSGGSAAAPPPPAAPQPPPASPQPPPDNSQSEQGADNGSSNPPAPDDPAPTDPPADDNPPDGEN
jgi:hypothetical protein